MTTFKITVTSKLHDYNQTIVTSNCLTTFRSFWLQFLWLHSDHCDIKILWLHSKSLWRQSCMTISKTIVHTYIHVLTTFKTIFTSSRYVYTPLWCQTCMTTFRTIVSSKLCDYNDLQPLWRQTCTTTLRINVTPNAWTLKVWSECWKRKIIVKLKYHKSAREVSVTNQSVFTIALVNRLSVLHYQDHEGNSL